MPLLLSVIVTSFNEGANLDRLFQDLSNQDFDINTYEILFLEAGNDSKERAANINSSKENDGQFTQNNNWRRG
jgi:glycosyltransferase involved in cell wall biosynthesis